VTGFVIEDCVIGSYATCPEGIGGTAGMADCFNALFMVSGANGSSDTTIRNNVLLGGGTYPMTSGYLLSNNEAGSTLTINFYNNTVFAARNLMMKSNILGSVRNNIFITDQHLQGMGSATWSNNAWLKTADAVGTDNVFGDAKFLNPDISATTGYGINANWRLQASSPAVNAGVLDVNTPVTDADGHERVGAPDVGAFEYQTAVVADTEPPGPVSSLVAARTTGVTLSWINPKDSDFAWTRVLRSTVGHATSPTNVIGQIDIFDGAGEMCRDASVPDAATYYTVFACDRSGNWSVPTTVRVAPALTLVAPARTKVTLTTPKGPSARLRRGRAYRVVGYLKPRHKAGTKPVRVQAYRWNGTRWVIKRVYYAVVSDNKSYSKYKASLKLPFGGRWRLRAWHPQGPQDLTAYSGWRYFTVK
jgi:hypothetical protein